MVKETLDSRAGIKKWLSAALITASFLWLGWMLWREHDVIAATFEDLQLRDGLPLLASVVLGSLAHAVLFFVFKIILKHHSGEEIEPRKLAYIFFSGQIIRYLPGRFFGIAYQINETQDQIAPLTIVRVNLEFMIQVIIFNTLAAGCIFAAYTLDALTAAAAALIGLIVFAAYLRLNWIDPILGKISKLLPAKVSPHVATLRSASGGYGNKTILELTCVMLGYFLLYAGAWLILKRVFVQFSGSEMIVLFASYIISWLIGFLSVVTPGGLGVREVSFVLINSKILPHHQTAFVSIFVRFWLMAVDLLLFSLSLWLYRARPVRR